LEVRTAPGWLMPWASSFKRLPKLSEAVVGRELNPPGISGGANILSERV